MSNNQDRTLNILTQALHDWCVNMGGIAWVILGMLLLADVAVMLFLYRWIRNGDLTRQSALGFVQRQ